MEGSRNYEERRLWALTHTRRGDYGSRTGSCCKSFNPQLTSSQVWWCLRSCNVRTSLFAFSSNNFFRTQYTVSCFLEVQSSIDLLNLIYKKNVFFILWNAKLFERHSSNFTKIHHMFKCLNKKCDIGLKKEHLRNANLDNHHLDRQYLKEANCITVFHS